VVRRALPLILLTVALSQICTADPVQFVDAQTGAYASYSRVEIDDRLIGYTDMYGRIKISMPKGDYPCSVKFFGHTFQVRLSITGDANLKRIELSR
jgi:hypothetical protein